GFGAHQLGKSLPLNFGRIILDDYYRHRRVENLFLADRDGTASDESVLDRLEGGLAGVDPTSSDRTVPAVCRKQIRHTPCQHSGLCQGCPPIFLRPGMEPSGDTTDRSFRPPWTRLAPRVASLRPFGSV